MLVPMTETAPSDPVQALCEEFRRHLDRFYAALQLAPPYHSVEQAVARLTAALRAMPSEERMRLLSDAEARWTRYRTAFVESGLHRKHRGIIAGLAKTGRTGGLPEEYDRLLSLFTAD